MAWSTTETEISGEIEKFYIDVIGIHLPQPSANMAEMPNATNANYLKGLLFYMLQQLILHFVPQ